MFFAQTAPTTLDPWIPIVVQIALGILTVAASGILSGVITYKLTAQKARREFFLAKLEDLYQAWATRRNMVDNYYATLQEARKEPTTYSSVSQKALDIRNTKIEKYELQREKLITLYFPELRHTFLQTLYYESRAENFAPFHQTYDFDEAFRILRVSNEEFRNRCRQIARRLNAYLKPEISAPIFALQHYSILAASLYLLSDGAWLVLHRIPLIGTTSVVAGLFFLGFFIYQVAKHQKAKKEYEILMNPHIGPTPPNDNQ